MANNQQKPDKLLKFCGKWHFLSIAIFFFLVWICYRESMIETKGSVTIVNSNSFERKDVLNYLIHTPNCRIPDSKPFNEDVKPFYSRHQYIPCSKLEHLVYVKSDAHVNKLFINYTNSRLYTARKFKCCYSPVRRKNVTDKPDNYVKILDCIPFQTNTTVRDDTIIRVYCYNEYNHKIYENVYLLLDLDEVKNRTQIPSKNNKPLSVLFLGIDSMSKMNLMRTMPKTYNYLITNDWIGLKGYNKIGENTFPNLMGMLTGMNKSFAYKVCDPRTLGKLDNCDFIWYKYRKLGIITAYAEDEAAINTFNYAKTGFVNPPTDVYLRPYILAAESLKIMNKDTLKYCTGPVSSGERILNAAKDFALHVRGYPSFGFFWTNTFSHENINFASSMDEKMEELFIYLEENAILENTIVIFLSDHGFRIGEFRLTYSGWLEDRLPYIYFWIPKWFRKKFHREYKNLQANSRRLTTPYDVYMTLQHLLVLFGYDHRQQPSSACPKCKSLFLEADLDRTCEDAGVEQSWCTCYDYSHLDASDFRAISASSYVLEHIQNLLDTNFSQESKKCAVLALRGVKAAGITEKYVSDLMKNVTYILVIFEAVPYAVFEATVEVAAGEDYAFSINGDISRLDRYSDSSKCTQMASLKKYCHCRSFMNNVKSYFCKIFPCF